MTGLHGADVTGWFVAEW